MLHRNKNQAAYHELLRSDNLSLRVDTLPEVQRDQRREYRQNTAFLKRLGNGAVHRLAQVAYISTLGTRAFEDPNGEVPFEKELNKQWREAGVTAEQKFRNDHPNIAHTEADNFKKHQKEGIQSKVYNRSRWITDYFRPGKQSSLSKAVPMRSSRGESGFDGNYTELARTSLQDALQHRSEDGSIPLLGSNIAQQRLQEKEKALIPYEEIRQSEDSYMDGVATALWQLGFLEFENERKIKYAGGQFNPDITWERKGDDGTTASLPFDPHNELHRMLVPEGSSFSNPAIQIDNSVGEMNLRLVEAAVPAYAMAA